MQWALLLGGGLVILALVQKLSAKAAAPEQAAAAVAAPSVSQAAAEAAYGVKPTGMTTGAPKVAAAAGIAGTVGTAAAPALYASDFAGAGVLHGVAAAAGPIGIAVAAAIVLAKLIFKGADPRQVSAAKIDQAYTTAGRNIHALFDAHMLTKQAALDGINGLLIGAVQAEQVELDALAKGKPLNKPLMDAIPHIKEGFQAQLSHVGQTADTPTTQPVNLAKARTYYQKWQKGYYADCIKWAGQLTDTFIGNLPQGEYLK